MAAGTDKSLPQQKSLISLHLFKISFKVTLPSLFRDLYLETQWPEQNFNRPTTRKRRLIIQQKLRAKVYFRAQTLLSRAPFSVCSPSIDMLLRTRNLGISIWGGGSTEKHTTTAVRLSQQSRLRASWTSSREHRCGSLCAISSFLTMDTANWLLITSQRPSQPIIKNSSSSVSLTSRNSGSGVRGHIEPLEPFMCQSPIALATASWPLRYPSKTVPPRFSILSLSTVQLGLWSLESSTARPRFPNTARQSPAFATSNVLQFEWGWWGHTLRCHGT